MHVNLYENSSTYFLYKHVSAVSPFVRRLTDVTKQLRLLTKNIFLQLTRVKLSNRFCIQVNFTVHSRTRDLQYNHLKVKKRQNHAIILIQFVNYGVMQSRGSWKDANQITVRHITSHLPHSKNISTFNWHLSPAAATKQVICRDWPLANGTSQVQVSLKRDPQVPSVVLWCCWLGSRKGIRPSRGFMGAGGVVCGRRMKKGIN